MLACDATEKLEPSFPYKYRYENNFLKEHSENAHLKLILPGRYVSEIFYDMIEKFAQIEIENPGLC